MKCAENPKPRVGLTETGDYRVVFSCGCVKILKTAKSVLSAECHKH